MHREIITFSEFKKHFIDQPNPDCYVPVYYSFEEDETGEELRILNIDLICNWRLSDGKVKFYSVPFDDDKQFNELIQYLLKINDVFHQYLRDCIGKLGNPVKGNDRYVDS